MRSRRDLHLGDNRPRREDTSLPKPAKHVSALEIRKKYRFVYIKWK